MIDTVAFAQSVYTIVAAIPYGQVLTYGQIARMAGYSTHARLVGHLLHQAGDRHTPCHRVVNSQGRTAPHWPEQMYLLQAEGIQPKANGSIDMKTYGWDVFDTI